MSQPSGHVMITSYTEIIAAIEAGRVEMGYRQLDFEVLIGVTQGHWGKAAGLLQVKKFGIEKIFDALRGAGLRIRVEVDPDQRAKMLARAAKKFNPMQGNQARNGHAASLPSTAVLSRILRPIGDLGRKSRWEKTTPEQRSEHGRMMAMAGVKKRRKLMKKRARQQRAAHKARKSITQERI